MMKTAMMMKAVLQNGFGAPETVLSVSTVPKPKLTDPESVLIRVVASSVNTPDWISTLGIPYVLRPAIGGLLCAPKNRQLGTDVAGVVEQVGSKVRDFVAGDAVVGTTQSSGFHSPGAFAEYTTAKASNLIKKPASVSFEDAAGAVMSGVTALQTLTEGAKVRPGMEILINGASGGVGTFAVQMAKAQGAKVTGVCSGGNAKLVFSLGADHVIDYTKTDYVESNERFDVILDNVMNHSFKESAKVLKKDGIIIPNSVGADRSAWFGAIPSFVFKPRNYPAIDGAVTKEKLQQVMDMVENGTVRVVVDRVFSLDEADKAVAYMASRRAKGQVIIRVGQE